MKNTGKIFEEDFKKSVPDYCLIHRLYDPPQAFVQNKKTKFSHKNPCDFLVYSGKSHFLWAIECKSTGYKSMSYEDFNSNIEENKLIHKHQIIGLLKFAQYNGVKAGFMLNFRSDDKNSQRLYFMDINKFVNMCERIHKKSFNEIDLLQNGAIKISGEKQRTRWKWDIKNLIK